MQSSACRPWRMLVGVAVAAWCGTFAHGAGILAELTVEEKRAMLDAHNAQRRLWAKGGQGLGGRHPYAGGIAEMYWDPGLEAMAKKRAANCYYGHFGGSGGISDDYKEIRDKVTYGWTSPITAGENVALFKNNDQDFIKAASKAQYMKNSVQGWVNEGDLFDWQAKRCYADTCGHWNQVITIRSRYIGCAAATCENGIVGAPPQWNSGVVVQCNYWPPMDAGYPYEDGLNDYYASICIGCSYWNMDSNICDDHLCTGGINRLWFTTHEKNDTITQCDDGLGRPVSACQKHDNYYTAVPPPTEVPSTATPAPPTPAPPNAAQTECPQAERVVSFVSADTFDQNAPLTFGGNFRVTGTALIELPRRSARVFDFGNGPDMGDNVVLHQDGSVHRLALSVLVGTRWQSIKCNRPTPYDKAFTFEASVIDGHGALYVNGKLCAEGPVAAPLLVQRNVNLIGKAHPSKYHKGTDGQLDGEVSSFQLHMCGPRNAVPSAAPMPDAIPTAAPNTPAPTPPATAAPNTAAPTPPPTAVPSTATPAPPTTTVPSTATPVPPPVATPAPVDVDPAHTECPQAAQVVSFQSADTFDQKAPLTFGGNFRVTAHVLINRYGNYARVFDFGNGPRKDNVLVTQHGRTGTMSMYVFVGARSQYIKCNTQAPLGRPFALEVSVLNGNAVMYVDGALCAQGPVTAPLAVSRSGNLIGQSHWSHDGPLDGEVTSFELETCEA
eukprot:TRINITY_DN2877_c0_g1_i5.p1 TRINITY_DN2877_c0_g1~~TRINITY_DN2877_c0_g1_i5.p1  ORF type:complete len:742 (+),score=170.63 TRINITY_DN2877_c0_g1_i5:59-2227(+)